MSANGTYNHPQDTPSSPPGSVSPISILADASPRRSLEDDDANDRAPNGHGSLNGRKHQPRDGQGPLSQVQMLEMELEETRKEKEALAMQYQNLLGRLTAMRTTLGNKLKQDAEELDRREQLIQQLTAQQDDLSSTVETLREELILSHEEAARASSELDALRSRALREEHESLSRERERELLEVQSELERVRVERHEWEQVAMREKVEGADALTLVETLRRDLDLERRAREREGAELESERERAVNLQSVLEDFQAAKDHELQQAIKEHETRLSQTTQSLAEFKSRALKAEAKLDEVQTDTSRIEELERELKEKSLLAGKLRHEAVTLNDYLREALRRLKRPSSDEKVDRVLVSNLIVKFLSTPREDTKKYEMLAVLSNVLSWSEHEQELVGLRRVGSSASNSGGFSLWGKAASPATTPSKLPPTLEKTDETESFARRWVEFLLTEASSGESTLPNSLPTSPIRQSHGSVASFPRSLSSLSAAGTASSPNLTSMGLLPPPSPGSSPWKGKGKEAGL